MRALNGFAFARVAVVCAVVGVTGVSLANNFERLYEPENPDRGAELLAIGPRGKMLYVRASSEAKTIEAIDTEHGKVRATYEALSPVTCACVDEHGDWLLGGDAEGRVFRWNIKTGERVMAIKLPGVAGKARAVRAIQLERHGGVFLLGGDVVLMLSRNVFGARFAPETDSRAVLYKPGQLVELFNERQDLAIVNSGDGSYHGYQISKDREMWVLELGYPDTTFIDVERGSVFVEGRDAVRLFDARKGKARDEDDEVKPVLGVAASEGGRVFVGTETRHVTGYTIEANGKLRRAHLWGALDTEITGMRLDPREVHLYVSDTSGTIYKIAVDAANKDDQNDQGPARVGG